MAGHPNTIIPHYDKTFILWPGIFKIIHTHMSGICIMGIFEEFAECILNAGVGRS